MASLLVQHHVNDFSKWKTTFDSHSSLRTSFGELSTQLFRDASDPNKITVISKWNSVDNAQKFASSPELKAAMENAGVEGMPNISFLNEV